MRLRTRVARTGPHTRRWVVTRNSDGAQISTGSDGPWDTNIMAESIRDTYPSVRNDRYGFPVVNQVFHEKGTCSLLGSHKYSDGVNSVTYNAGYAADALVFSPTDFCSFPFSSGEEGQMSMDFASTVGVDMVSFTNDTQEAWRPIPSSASFANDILEIKDITRLANSAKDLAKVLVGLSSTWKYSSRGLVNGFLAYNFGLIPLISTAKAIASSSEKIFTRLAFLRSTRGHLTSLVNARTGSYQTSPPPGWGNPANSFMTYAEVHTTYKFTIGGHLYQNLIGLDDAMAPLRAFRDYGGFDQILKIAWNAIPYSFVVDWLTHFGDTLGQYRLPASFDGEYRIISPWCACSSHGTGVFWMWHYPSFNGALPAAHGTLDRYVRIPGLPAVTATTQLSWLQQALAGALLIQPLLT